MYMHIEILLHLCYCIFCLYEYKGEETTLIDKRAIQFLKDEVVTFDTHEYMVGIKINIFLCIMYQFVCKYN